MTAGARPAQSRAQLDLQRAGSRPAIRRGGGAGPGVGPVVGRGRLPRRASPAAARRAFAVVALSQAAGPRGGPGRRGASCGRTCRRPTRRCWAAPPGLTGVVGLMAFYRALSVGSMSVIAPISALGAAGARRRRPGRRRRARRGRAGGDAARPRRRRAGGARARAGLARGVGLAVVAALGFGGFFSLLAEAADGESALWSLIMARGASVPFAAGGRASAVGASLALRGRVLLMVAVAGVLDASANLMFAAGSQRGLTSVVAVLGSLYPVTTVGARGRRPARAPRAPPGGGRRVRPGRRRDDRRRLSAAGRPRGAGAAVARYRRPMIRLISDDRVPATTRRSTPTRARSRPSRAPSGPSVVSIRVGRRGGAQGAGSGVVITPDGFVLTSAHVVDGADGALRARLVDGRELALAVVGRRPPLRPRGAARRGRRPARRELGDADRLEVGQLVVAIGNPLGLRRLRDGRRGVRARARPARGRPAGAAGGRGRHPDRRRPQPRQLGRRPRRQPRAHGGRQHGGGRRRPRAWPCRSTPPPAASSPRS